MKRILISLLISGCSMILYTSIVLGLEMLRLTTKETTFKLATPFRLPTYIYYNILQIPGSVTSMGIIIFACVAILVNLILYTSVIYLLLMLIPKKAKEPEVLFKPPEPPKF